jgi:carbamoyltransferase
VRGEPVACTPEDAFRCLMGTEIDLLIVGSAVLYKYQRDSDLMSKYEDISSLTEFSPNYRRVIA